MNTKATILTLMATLATTSTFASPKPPVIFNAGQGISSVSVTSKMTTMGMTMDLPLLEVKNVIKPSSQAQFCSEVQQHKPQNVQMQVSTCTFNGNAGSIKGSMNVAGTAAKVVYNYSFH